MGTQSRSSLMVSCNDVKTLQPKLLSECVGPTSRNWSERLASLQLHQVRICLSEALARPEGLCDICLAAAVHAFSHKGLGLGFNSCAPGAGSSSGTAAASAPTVSSQQEAAPPAQTANNGSATASKPAPTLNPAPDPTPPAAPAPVSNNGHSHDTETAGNGNGKGTSSSATAVSHSTTTSDPASSPANNGANPPRQPVGNANPSIPPRSTGNAHPSIPPRPNGSANPSIPPRPSSNANPSIPPRQQAIVPAGPARQPAGNGQVAAAAAPAAEEESAENRELREKVQNFRVLLVRLTLRLGQSTRGSIVQQVNYRCACFFFCNVWHNGLQGTHARAVTLASSHASV